MDHLTVEIRKDSLFNISIDVLIRVLPDIWCDLCAGRVFFAEAIKWSFFSGRSTVESTLNRHYTTHCVILHIVGENHQLCDINEPAELLVGKALAVHSGALSDHATMVIRFLRTAPAGTARTSAALPGLPGP